MEHLWKGHLTRKRSQPTGLRTSLISWAMSLQPLGNTLLNSSSTASLISLWFSCYKQSLYIRAVKVFPKAGETRVGVRFPASTWLPQLSVTPVPGGWCPLLAAGMPMVYRRTSKAVRTLIHRNRLKILSAFHDFTTWRSIVCLEFLITFPVFPDFFP